MGSDTFWNDWRRDRLQKMLAFGVPRNQAEPWLAAELNARKHIARSVGNEAAAIAPMRLKEHADGSVTPSFLIDSYAIPEPRRSAVQDVAFGPKTGKPTKN